LITRRRGPSWDQVDSLPEGDPTACIIGPAIVRTQSGAVYFADSGNYRPWLSDQASIYEYNNVAGGRQYSWSSGDVEGSIPDGGAYGDPYFGKIVKDGPTTAYFVAGNGRRYWIPTGAVYWCLRNQSHPDLGPLNHTGFLRDSLVSEAARLADSVSL